MGWWEVSKDPKIITGDLVLDLTRRFLQEVSHEYQRDLGRKPTLGELEYTLNLGFTTNLTDEILEGFEELELKLLVLKTAKRPKRVKPKPGDIFAFKILNKDLFGFGRLISTVSVGMVAEVFDYFSPRPFLDHSKLDTWLFSPIIINQFILFESKMHGDWRIIEHSDDFEIGKKFHDVIFFTGQAPNLTAVHVDGSRSPVSQQEAAGHREYYAMNDSHVQKLIVEALKAR